MANPILPWLTQHCFMPHPPFCHDSHNMASWPTQRFSFNKTHKQDSPNKCVPSLNCTCGQSWMPNEAMLEEPCMRQCQVVSKERCSIKEKQETHHLDMSADDMWKVGRTIHDRGTCRVSHEEMLNSR